MNPASYIYVAAGAIDQHGHPYETDLLGLLDQYHNHEGGQA